MPLYQERVSAAFARGAIQPVLGDGRGGLRTGDDGGHGQRRGGHACGYLTQKLRREGSHLFSGRYACPFLSSCFVQKTWPDGGDAGGCAFPEHGPARSRVQEAHAVALGDLARAFHRGARSFLNILVEGAGARALQETIPADRGDARGLLRVEALPRSSVVLGIFSLCWKAERAMLPT